MPPLDKSEKARRIASLLFLLLHNKQDYDGLRSITGISISGIEIGICIAAIAAIE